MAGIPVYTAAPINAAAKAAPATSTTNSQGPHTPSKQGYVPAMTTATPTSTYPSAQPGQSSVPQPTGVANNRYAPSATHTSPTRTQDTSLPPPPQPGAVPSPYGKREMSPLPPPPKAGEHYTPPPPQSDYYPSQIGIQPPTTTNTYGGIPPSDFTSTSNAALPGTNYPVSLPVGYNDSNAPRRSVDHPPGYVQNTSAQNMSASARVATEAMSSHTLSSNQYGYTAGYGGGQSSSNDTVSRFDDGPKAAFGVDPEKVWDGVKSWAGWAGTKLQEGEKEVWRRVNGEK